MRFSISGNLVDVSKGRVFPATVEVIDGRIGSVTPTDESPSHYLIPGFVDAHVHVESSMLVPSEFARAAVRHGTVASVSDPHEIGNVLGVEGVHYMLENAHTVPFKFYFGAPSCVPATPFETAGDQITAAQVETLLDDDRIGYLSEMMNFPGVLNRDAEVLAKLHAAHQRGKQVDGHAPGLRGADAKQYIESGITTDHECFTKEEAEEKISYGAKIAIREGSAARNFDALYPLLDERPGACFLCSDDKHPDELLEGHINVLVKRAIQRGIDLMNALRAASLNPIAHYGLDVGLLREGDSADFLVVDNLDDLTILQTYIAGQIVAETGQTKIETRPPSVVNRFTGRARSVEEFQVVAKSRRLNVIEAIDGQLITRRLEVEPKVADGYAVSDTDRDLLKIAVVNRYGEAPPAIAFIQHFGLRSGAMASSVAHDSHNVIAVGANDRDLCAAINRIIDGQGGLAVVEGDEQEVLKLPIAGLMATGSCESVGAAYARLDSMVKRLGSTLRAPFMTLSFMALLVIPELKLSDQGLFDGKRFEFIPLFVPD